MKLIPSDPDVQTIVSRIKDGTLNLQPDFQRGEVWSDAKKRRLVDSILRNWHVPPIHVVQISDTEQQEVLDGQQRLAAIRDFVDGHIRVDGNVEPMNSELNAIHGLTYHQLPSKWRRRFDQFTIRVFRITDYEPSEPNELFFRLNQPSNLTPPEQRNAFIGVPRQQVKDLVSLINDFGFDKDFLGFSNSRMAYDDVLSKICLTIEGNSLLVRLSAGTLAERYRSGDPFGSEVIERVHHALAMLAECKPWIAEDVRFNKATLYSWLCFMSGLQKPPVVIHPREIGGFISWFERTRTAIRASSENEAMPQDEMSLLAVFNDRASSRVADVLSVVARDAVIWVFFLKYCESGGIDLPCEHPRVMLLKGADLHAFDYSTSMPQASMLLYKDGAPL